MIMLNRRHKNDTGIIDGLHCDSASWKVRYERLPMHGAGRYSYHSNEEGQTVIEVALVLPILLGAVMAIYSFGTAFFNLQSLRNAVSQGGQALQIAQSFVTDPCKTAEDTVSAVAPTLTQTDIHYRVIYNNTSVYPDITGADKQNITWTGGSSKSCALASGTTLDTRTNVTLIADYPCNLQIYGIPIDSSCRISATTTFVAQ
jgi:Flp pilus assembly protein TadG